LFAYPDFYYLQMHSNYFASFFLLQQQDLDGKKYLLQNFRQMVEFFTGCGKIE